MITIYKYELQTTDIQTLPLPKGATILSAQVQRGTICLWVKMDTNEGTLVTHIIRVHGTGHPIGSGLLRFIDTVQLHDGALIFHIFEEVS